MPPLLPGKVGEKDDEIPDGDQSDQLVIPRHTHMPQMLAGHEVIGIQQGLVLIDCLDRPSKFDIIHIHGAETLIPLFKLLGKKIVLHYHGSDINEKSRSKSYKRIFCRSMADLIIFNGKKMEENIHP